MPVLGIRSEGAAAMMTPRALCHVGSCWLGWFTFPRFMLVVVLLLFTALLLSRLEH